MNALRALLSTITAPLRWIARIPVKLVGAPQRLMGLSFSARVALLLALSLLLLVGTAFACYALLSDRPDWSVVARWPVMLTIVALLMAIPLVVYQALRLWLEGETSRYPDIDEAWRSGLNELRKQGVDLQQMPLYLIIGASDRALSDALLRGSGYDLLVDGAPDGKSALRWYASHDAVFLVTEETGCLSRLTALVGRSPAPAAAAASGPSITGTLVAGGGDVRDSSVPSSFGPAAGSGIRGTLVPDGGGDPGGGGAPVARASGRLLAHADYDDEADRLAYLGQLLRRIRQPFCPINGILVLAAVPLLRDIVAAQDANESIRRDLETLRDATQLSCPVVLLVSGMESVPGFTELVRRVGLQRAKETRFGKGYSVWNPADRENMEALSIHACGAFEDWVYALYREPGGLGKPGNGKLYRLLCLVRGQLQNRIRGLLTNAFGHDDESEESGYWMFGGCYFAATGASADRHAFVRSVIDKLIQQDEDVEWCPAALDEEQRYRRIAQGLTVVNALLGLVLAGLVIWMFL